MSTRDPFYSSSPLIPNGLRGLLSLGQPQQAGAISPYAQTSLQSLASLAAPAPLGLLSSLYVPPPVTEPALGLISRALIPKASPYNSAVAVATRFQKFLDNIALTDAQFADGERKLRTVTSCLNRTYWGHNDENRNRVLAGSWSKQTRVRRPRDIDLLFILPYEVYCRYESRLGNKQSQLLQEVKQALLQAFPRTEMRGDGQVVMVNFESYAVEVVPAFLLNNNRQYWICDTNYGGRYKVADPVAEKSNIEFSEQVTKGNSRRLIRMMKKWQNHCNVPLKSFWIELLVVDFLRHWPHARKGYEYYDWMVRDFLADLVCRPFTYLEVPGTLERVTLGDEWFSKAISALGTATRACKLESQECPYLAGDEWQDLFGSDFPV